MASTVQNQEVNQDDLILQQQRSIEKEISDSIPLISEVLEVGSLDSEYSSDTVYMNKVKKLGERYSGLRRIRPDGNCFFRAFAYNYLEYLVQNKEKYEEFYIIADGSKDKLVKLGFPQFTIEDFYDTFMDVVKRVRPGDDAAENEKLLPELHKLFNEQGYSDYVVVYLRLITSGQLQERADFYQNFIDGLTIEEFRHKEVEPMYKESDHIHIIALCTELKISVGVEYMDRGEGQMNFHVFPEEGVKPKIHLLYRPGHYDILYPRN